MFRVGQKVVCVDARNVRKYSKWPIREGSTLDGLSEGLVYTIRAIGSFRGVPCIWLDEIVRMPDLYGEAGYHPARFRPVVERKTDIGWAHEILRKATKKKRAPAFPAGSHFGG